MTLKRIVGIFGAVLLVTAWSVVGIGLLVEVDRQLWTYLIIAAAIATEVFIWCMAAMLGLTIFEARRKIWRSITGLGRTNSSPPRRNSGAGG
jgi:hypothetical protein